MADATMAPAATQTVARPATHPGLRIALLSLLAFVLAEVLLEAWLQAVLSPGLGEPFADWLRLARNGAYLAMALLAAVDVLATGTARRFTTAPDLALFALALILAGAGLVGGSGVILTAQAMFVYLRGVIVLYVIRVLAPTPAEARPVLWIVGLIIGLNAIAAIAQGIFGPVASSAVGWVDSPWAAAGRAQGLQLHPNHLGHVTALMSLGALAVLLGRQRARRWWWPAFVILVVALALSQSRESVLALLVAAAAMLAVHRGRIRVALAGAGVVLTAVVVIWVAQPSNLAELARRWNGVVNAILIPAGSNPYSTCEPGTSGCTIEGVPQRELRVLYVQQGLTLWARSPLLGYGVGQFGGAVAYQADPQWNLNPRFGPDGFDLHGFSVRQVDSFWLHLLVEAGLAGSLAYLAWLVLLGLRAARAARRLGGEQPFVTLAAPALVFGVVIAVFSPALEDPIFPPLLFGIIGLGWIGAGNRA